MNPRSCTPGFRVFLLAAGIWPLAGHANTTQVSVLSGPQTQTVTIVHQPPTPQITSWTQKTFTEYFPERVSPPRGALGFLPNSTAKYHHAEYKISVVTNSGPSSGYDGEYQLNADWIGGNFQITKNWTNPPGVTTRWEAKFKETILGIGPLAGRGIGNTIFSPSATQLLEDAHIIYSFEYREGFGEDAPLVVERGDVQLSNVAGPTIVPGYTSSWRGPLEAAIPSGCREDESAIQSQTEYYFTVPSEYLGKTIHWVIVFTPEDGSPPEHTMNSWLVDGSESPVYHIPSQTRDGCSAVTLVDLELAVDANRDGTIKLASEDASDATSPVSPHRFWMNNDDDAGDTRGTDISDSSASIANYKDQVVNGTRDLVDFFPVFLDLKQLLSVLPPSTPGVKYKLKQADGALNFIYTSLARDTTQTRGGALSYQREIFATGFGDQFDRPPGEAATHQISAAGFELSPVFLTGVKDSDWGVILIEGRSATSAPMVLSVEQGTAVLAEIKLELRISNVEDMFRHVDLARVPTNYDGTETTPPAAVPAPRTGDPGDAWPDSITNGKYFVFVHGYNIDGQSARGWESEIFKRLHALGSNARYVGVTWNGATGIKLSGSYTNYHQAVFNAFQTGDALATALSFTDQADVTVAAHSLGNVVTSHAIQAAGFAPTRYFMINAAAPVEAYIPGEVTSAEQLDMVERDWKPYESRLHSANWHRLFVSSDRRSELTWQNRFVRVRTQIDSHDFYSAGDDVVADAAGTDTASIAASLLRQGLDFSTGAWKLQELVKGVNWFQSGASLFMDRGQAGWGLNSSWYKVRGQTNSGPVTSRRFPEEADEAQVPTAALRTQPFFLPFLNLNLTNSDEITASAAAAEMKVQYDLLARGIPAKSYAVATRKIAAFEPTSRNFDMEVGGRTPYQWPTEGHTREGTQGRWLHSDFKNVALPYVYRMFEEIIERGTLNETAQ